jgi:protein involved in polysaccharide export with SLBB domain
MNHRRRSLVALIAVIVTPLLSVPSQEPSSQTLEPGDQVRISVWKNTELSGDFTIARDGTILHPLYRDVKVTGLPMSVVEDRIRTFLQTYQTNPQFIVQPLVRIIVGGEVRTPNVYSVPPETTVAQAIATAAGLTERGNLEKVILIRDRRQRRLDLTRVDSDVAMIQIRSGDQILVGRASPPIINYLGPVASTIAAAAAILSIALK